MAQVDPVRVVGPPGLVAGFDRHRLALGSQAAQVLEVHPELATEQDVALLLALHEQEGGLDRRRADLAELDLAPLGAILATRAVPCAATTGTSAALLLLLLGDAALEGQRRGLLEVLASGEGHVELVLGEAPRLAHGEPEGEGLAELEALLQGGPPGLGAQLFAPAIEQLPNGAADLGEAE